ncbi:uncharacterized protein N7483_012713 [Penicillium malachiteum]|uniref:uncharacterized protein n=1 Tax=Penicillium malachiteum TaxID=1324776 RepID=UPI0025465A1E|nr:uncharacterized protein N7483_012713 [Penicillium malachiteum]KAJ5715532.1 hypothetical protein N7483_012713 [Penicillium malachiteum]
MLGLRAIFSWFTLCLVASNVAAVTIDNLFNLPTTSTDYGTCNNNLTRLNAYSSDFTTLCTQLDNAVQLAKTPGQTQAKLVARQLFTAWFGIRFNTDGTVQTASETAWTVVQVSFDGDYQAPTSPANLFCNDFGDIYPWNSFIKDSQGNQMQPGITVAYFYSDWVPNLPGVQLPYYVDPINKYYMMPSSAFIG